MFVTMLSIVFFVMLGVFSTATSSSQPLSPFDYQRCIAQGFSTNWFKTYPPLSKYNEKNIKDVFVKGFRNLRLRSRADLYTAPYNDAKFNSFLNDLSKVVDKCLQVGVFPIISWVHHHAEAYASKTDRKNYVIWWRKVANKLKDKDHRLSFNLFTELGIDECGSKEKCGESLRMRPDKYNRWTSDVVAAIRATGGNNANRILILGSPGKTAKDLYKIDSAIYKDDPYMMVEWHIYASGPNKKDGGLKYWKGNGEPVNKNGKGNVDNAIKPARDFTANTGILTYLGAWMPQDNDGGELKQWEVISFGRYFASKLKNENITWSLNVLDRYYDTKSAQWLTGIQIVQKQRLDMAKVLNNIEEVMGDTPESCDITA